MSGQVLFQALPPLAPDEYRALEDSILAHGVQVPIVVDENGTVIDGHHRQKITNHHGLPCPSVTKSGYTEAEKRTLALSLNIDRRHLNREQKRALIVESIKADPQLSNREHAKRTGTTDPTVGTVRKELEDSGEVQKFSTSIGADGKTYPKPRPVSDPEPPADTNELIDQAINKLDEVPEWLKDKPSQSDQIITPDDLEALNTPPVGRKTRRPITDQARDAAIELQKAIERVERLMDDERCDRNREELGIKLRASLQYTQNVCTKTLTYLNGQ